MTTTSWKPEVLVEGKWSANGVAFPTVEEARAAAADLMGRWTLVRDWRAVESNDPANYRWVDGKPVRLPDA